MIAAKFRTALAQHPDRPFIVSASGEQSYADFHHYAARVAARIAELPPGRLACHLPDSQLLIAVMVAAGMSGRSLVLFNHAYDADKLAELVAQTEAVALLTDLDVAGIDGCELVGPEHFAPASLPAPAENGLDADGEILILTSGTTGKPKCARYTWSRLLAQVTVKPAVDDERWLLAYRLNHFAGVQMIAHVISNAATLVIPDSTSVADAIAALGKYAVTHVSSTPTFWRYALTLLQARRDEISLRHITLGSEAASADLLDKLHALFPEARIVQIYASTEAGSCVSVSDMKPGLPADILNRSADAAVQFRIVDDELQIRAANGMQAYLDGATNQTEDGWRASGDLVRIENGRILFVGRRNETINVGGVKVHPLDVENLITPVAGVRLVRVYGKDNPIVGQIVAVDVVAEDGADEATVESAIREACGKLPPASQPRSINFVDAMLTNNMKLSRR